MEQPWILKVKGCLTKGYFVEINIAKNVQGRVKVLLLLFMSSRKYDPNWYPVYTIFG